MERIVDVAQYVYKYYLKETDEKIDEMKLHKLLYFVQRESYVLLGKTMFNEDFEGWIHGPVSKEVRSCCDMVWYVILILYLKMMLILHEMLLKNMVIMIHGI